MLFTPEAHEPLAGEPWSAERAKAAIAAIVADAEGTFDDDGWPLHPEDAEEDDDPAKRFRSVYLGGAGVVAALDRLARRGFVELRRDYVPYLERSLAAAPDFPDENAEGSLWMGEAGIRLVLQRLAPARANLDRLAELIAAHEQDGRRELMWGSPGTILAGRELGLDVSASCAWLREQREPDGLWTQDLYGRSRRFLVPRMASRVARSLSEMVPASRRPSLGSRSRRRVASTGRRSRGWSSTRTGTGESAPSGATEHPASSRRSLRSWTRSSRVRAVS